MNTFSEKNSSPMLSRPVGVWILSILNILISGLFPIITAMAYLMITETQSSALDLSLALLQGGLALAIVWTVIGTWQGKKRERTRFLLVLSIFHGLQIMSNMGILLLNEVPFQLNSRFLGAIVRSIFWMGINWWYFRRWETMEWLNAMEDARQAQGS